MGYQPLILAAAALLLAGVLLSKTSSRLGVPSLLLFLGLGMLAGSDGILGIEFDDFELARGVGIVALAFILFAGGLSTRWTDIRPVLVPGVALASVGVILSAVVLGSLAAWILGLGMLEGVLLASIIASTDAAAVFSILRSRGVALRGRLRPLLELESGSNDPAAVFLTVGLIAIIEADEPNWWALGGSFVWQMAIGAIAGVVLARVAIWAINRLHLEFDGLYPVATFAFVLASFEVVTFVGGSGFLAVYVAGVTMANGEFLHKRSLVRFHDAIAWLMQIAMFVLLGLLVFPSRLPAVAGSAIAVAALLILVARPLAVAITLVPFRTPPREIALVSWVGLRGATPIILATFPVAAGIPDADRLFDVVFFVVLTSVLVQGTTIPAVARRLEVTADSDPTATDRTFDAVITGDAGPNLHELAVEAGSAADGETVVGLGLPHGVLIVLVRRGDVSLMPQGGTVLEAGDKVLLLAEGDRIAPVVGTFRASSAEDEPV